MMIDQCYVYNFFSKPRAVKKYQLLPVEGTQFKNPLLSGKCILKS